MGEGNVYCNVILSFSLSLLFIILASPHTFKRTGKVIYNTTGLTIEDDGKAYAPGVLFHSVLFFVLALSITRNDYLLFAFTTVLCTLLAIYL